MNSDNEIYFNKYGACFNGDIITGMHFELGIYTNGKVQCIEDSGIVYENIESFIKAINDDLQKQETRIEKGYVYLDNKTALIILEKLKNLLYAMAKFYADKNGLPIVKSC